ncbi:MAG: HAMP domain-containing histidine kinase, partial [Bacteroidetes bacterium]|nr:HAMP domain-containing histidine kinase [Bacteroidota bacterium]
FSVSIQDIQLYFLAFCLLVLNYLHFFILRKILKKEGGNIIRRIKREIHFQIITDFIILTLVLHFSGGIENPVIIFFFFHMIIASSIFSIRESYLHMSFALILIALLVFLECYGLIPHHHLEGFANDDLFQNRFYIYGAGTVYVVTSLFLVSLTHMIISRSIRVEETYVKTNRLLEKKDKLQNEYVLRVTHDIKGHLAAIISCLSVVKNGITGPLNESQTEFINRADDRVQLLLGFVKDMLNLTKKRLQSDTEFEEFSLRDVINKVVASVQVLAKEKSIAFNTNIVNAVQTMIGDAYTIEELYSNLLFNAVKYTPENGRVELLVRIRDNFIITEISDSGIGIPPDEIDKVFNEFYRASNVPRDFKTGSGLGLSIVQQIVAHHKGRIKVQSEVGLWTKFTIFLPVNPITARIKYDERLSTFGRRRKNT